MCPVQIVSGTRCEKKDAELKGFYFCMLYLKMIYQREIGISHVAEHCSETAVKHFHTAAILLLG